MVRIRDIRTSEFVIHRIGEAFYKQNFRLASNKLELLADAFQQARIIVVWDNFESAAENLSSADRSELGRFVAAIHGKLGKVIITSRSDEEWLPPSRRFKLALGGLDGEERWEYCETVLNELGLSQKVNRSDPELKNLMDQLAGHPLAMRAILPKLEQMSAAAIGLALRTNIKELGLNEEEEQGRLFATLRFVEQGLSDDLRPLLQMVRLHEGYLSAGVLNMMSEQVNPEWNRARIDQLTAALAGAGLMEDLGQALFHLHPLLTSYLRSQTSGVNEPVERAFVDVMTRLAESLAQRKLHEQRLLFHWHGSNIRHALMLARRLSFDAPIPHITLSLGSYAQSSGNLAEASQLFRELAEFASARGLLDFEAAAYHQLGMIAFEQRDFAAAQEWWLKSLAITEKQGNLEGAATTYHELGIIAQEQRDFAAAREWFLKSLAITERQGNLQAAAMTYHQLGINAVKQGDYADARKWYLRSLAIKEKQGNLQGAASTYNELGIIALEQRDYATARDWYLKSLAIEEKQSNQSAAAITYHNLGIIAAELQDYATARNWFLKSLAIKEQHGDLQGAAATYHQLGRIAREQEDYATAREWYRKSLAITEKQGNINEAGRTYVELGLLEGTEGNMKPCAEAFSKAMRSFLVTKDETRAAHTLRNFVSFYHQASEADKPIMKSIWEQASLGPLPTE